MVRVGVIVAHDLELLRAHVPLEPPKIVGRNQVAVRIVRPTVHGGREPDDLLVRAVDAADQGPTAFGRIRGHPMTAYLVRERGGHPERHGSTHRCGSLRYHASGSAPASSMPAATAAPADHPISRPVVRARQRAWRSAVSVGISAIRSGSPGSYSVGGSLVVARCFRPSRPLYGESGCTPTKV